MKLIIFLTLTYGNKRDSKRLGFEHLKKNNFKVEQWNLGPWLLPNYAQNYIPYDKIDNLSYDVKDKSYFNKIAKKIDKETYLFDPWNCYSFFEVQNILSRKKFRYCSMITNNCLVYDTIAKFKLKLFLFLKNKKKPKISNYSTANTKKYLNYFMYAGKESKYTKKFYLNENTKKIRVNSHDYDNFITIKYQKKPIINSDYSVFIDEAFPNHPDLNLYKDKTQCEPEVYYRELNNFFDLYEKKTNNKIIIAGHPRINYDSFKKSNFGNREIITHKTDLLIKFANDILVHTSQAHCYAIIYNKRLIWLDSVNYNYMTRLLIQSRSRYLKSNIVKISDLKMKIKLKSISNLHYQKYFKNYIKEDKSITDKTVWEIFTDNIANEY